MMVIYHDVGGAHSSCVAANVHLNNLSRTKVPTKEDLQSLKTFDKIEKNDIGRLIYIGTDEFGIKVYTFGRKRTAKISIPAISDMYSIFNEDKSDLILADTSPTVNILMQIGGFSSRVLHLVSFGRPIVTTGTINTYPNIVKVVDDVKEQIRKKKGL